jgi:3',5'-cyclic AMP phosphodiesterase CpdA
LALLATSDLHVSHSGNRPVLDRLRPYSDDDWLLVAGDVAETMAEVEEVLGLLSERFVQVVWAPGNHELWTTAGDVVRLRGEARYDHLVGMCRGLGVLTPEDPYAEWQGDDGPLVVAPLFLLYDYSFRSAGVALHAALAQADERGVVCTDEFLLHPDPYPTRQDWCAHRLEVTARRLDAIPSDRRTVLVSHFPLHRGPTRLLRHPDFAMWCGTTRTADWHLRYRAEVVVYGHLHIPLTLWFDGVRFEEASVGYPREWRARSWPLQPLRRVMPPDPARSPAPSAESRSP